MASEPLILPSFEVSDLRGKGLGPFCLPQDGHTALPQRMDGRMSKSACQDRQKVLRSIHKGEKHEHGCAITLSNLEFFPLIAIAMSP